MVFKRKSRSCRKRPAATSALTLAFVAASTRTSTRRAFENSLRKTAGVDRYHRLRVAARKRVERLCNYLLPGAVLAGNQHVCVGRPDARDELQHGLHRGGFRDEIRPRFGAQQPVFGLEA